MVDNNDLYEQLAEDYSLELILKQNDIEEWEVLHILFERGFLDIDDYIFTELEDLGDED